MIRSSGSVVGLVGLFVKKESVLLLGIFIWVTDPWYIHLYRKGHAYHGVHPFYMWYWGAHALDHLGGVIILGGDPKTTRRLGYTPASTMADAIEMAKSIVGRDPTLTHLHSPPLLMANVH